MPGREVDTGVLLLLRGDVEETLVREVATEEGLTVMRRCADVAELLAAALAGLGTVAVVDHEFGVDRTTIDRLQSQGTRVLVCCPPDHVRRYDALGAMGLAHGVAMIPAIHSLARSTDEAQRVVDALASDPAQEPLADAALQATARPDNARPDAALHDAALADDGLADQAAPVATVTGPARVLAVTGAQGAPGRSTLTINIADVLASQGESVLLVDADLWGGALAQMLGMLADTAGLSAAVRAADQGTLDASALGRLAPRVRPGLRLLPGLARAARWREVSAAAVAEILQVAGREHSWVVVEAPVLVPEEDSAFGFGPGRNDVAGAVLGAAEEIAVVGAAEPVGMERLVQTLLDLDDLTAPGRRHVLVNRVRASAAGPRAAASVQEALARFADVQDPVLIPDDRAMCDRCVLEGTTWRESSSRSPALRALSDFTTGLLQVTTGTGRRSRPARSRLLRWRNPARRRTPAH